VVLPALAIALTATVVCAGPIDFGKAELNQALSARGLKARSIVVERRAGPPESWSIRPGQVTGADERGLMYGLLEAAAQIRACGRLTPASGQAATAMRGIRSFMHNEDLEKSWYYSREYWEAYFSMLARNRFNRFSDLPLAEPHRAHGIHHGFGRLPPRPLPAR
jgi:hypothetical protein